MRRLIVMSVVVMLAGCGGSSKSSSSATRGYSSSPASAAQAYVAAFGSGDYATACSLIAKNTLAQVTQNGKFKCTDVYAKGGSKVTATQAFMKGATVSGGKVSGSNATVK